VSLEDLGNIGDFIGGVAVVVSLMYLAFQIRRNTLYIQASTIQSATEAATEIMELMARDPDVLRLFQAGTHDFEALSEFDRYRFGTVMGTLLYRFENLVTQTQRGLLPHDSWEGILNRLKGTFALPGTLAWWERGKHVFNVQGGSGSDRKEACCLTCR
jgi:hypothetical protein